MCILWNRNRNICGCLVLQNWSCACCRSISISYILNACFLSVSSRPCLPAQPDALQPGCVQPRPAVVPSSTSRPSSGQCSSQHLRLPCPASIQPSFRRTATQDWITASSLSAAFNVLRLFFGTWQSWKHVIGILMRIVLEHLDTYVLVVRYGNVMSLI